MSTRTSWTTPGPTQDGRERVGWWFALEPIGSDSVAWSLIRVDDEPPTGPVAAGIWTELGPVRLTAESLLPGRDAAEGSDELWTGPLVHPAGEPWTAVRLGQALLPDELRTELLAADLSAVRHTVTVACRGWLAQVPWEALALDQLGEVRLVERARVGAGLSPAVNAGRRLAPTPRPGAPALRVLDPGPRVGAGLKPLYPGGYPAAWDAEGVVAAGEQLLPDGEPLGIEEFGELLRAPQGWSRLFYFGHALAGTADTPAGAALVFSSATGAERFSAHAWLGAPQTWPSPARVALIACGSDDSVHLEQSGLPVAAVNAGAELLTVTRWTLPADDTSARGTATTALALAVDAAHREDDPLTAIARWQCERLAAWRAHGRRADSPLLWASLATYLVPAVELEPAP